MFGNKGHNYKKLMKSFNENNEYDSSNIDNYETVTLSSQIKIDEGDTFYYGELDTYGKKQGHGCEFNKSNNLKFREGYYENDEFIKGTIWIFREDHIDEIDENGKGTQFNDDKLFVKLEELNFKN